MKHTKKRIIHSYILRSLYMALIFVGSNVALAENSKTPEAHYAKACLKKGATCGIGIQCCSGACGTIGGSSSTCQ